MKRKRFNEGGMPDFEREPLRDSSGNIVTDSSGQPIMSGSTPGRTRAANIPPERMSTLDPSDIEDAIRGRMMTAAQNEPLKSPVRNEPVKSPVRSEYDTESGLDYSPGMGSRKPMATKPQVKPTGKIPAKPSAPVTPVTSPKPSAEDRLRQLQESDKPLETVSPEMNLLGGAALRGLKALGTGLAAKLAPKAVKPRVEPTIPQEPAKALGMSSRKGEVATSGRDLVRRRNTMEQLEAPRKRLPFEKNMGEARLETVANKRRQLTGNRRSDDVIEMGMKKGGKVSSASKRADGIAMRGKTRGKYI